MPRHKPKRGRPPKKLTLEQQQFKNLQLKLKEARRQLRVHRKQFELIEQLDGLLAKLFEETVPHWCFEYAWYHQLHDVMKALGLSRAGAGGFLPGMDSNISKSAICRACRHEYYEHFSLHGRPLRRTGCLQCDCVEFVGGLDL